MANELLTRDDIVRAKKNVDAHDKYLDGGAEEKVKLPSGKLIKTRAGVEKDLTDKFPDSKAGLRDVGNDLGNVPEVTPEGIGLSGLGSRLCLRFPAGLTAIFQCETNGFFRIFNNVSEDLSDKPDGVSGGILLNINYDDIYRYQQYHSITNGKIFVRLLKRDSIEVDYESTPWAELYNSRNTKPYQTTTATQPNLVVEATGELRRSTSSRVFKDNIQPLEVENYREALRRFEPVSYNSKHTSDNPEWIWYSFIAEDLAEVDTSLVQLSPIEFYEDTDEDGNTFVNNRQLPEGEYAPVGLNFNGIITMLTRINQHMLDDIEDLEKEKTQLKTRMTKLENRLAELEKLLPAS